MRAPSLVHSKPSCTHAPPRPAGVKRVFNFYSAARLDGLVRREELEGKKIIETFANRKDRMVYRSATYAEEPPNGGDDWSDMPGEE